MKRVVVGAIMCIGITGFMTMVDARMINQSKVTIVPGHGPIAPIDPDHPLNPAPPEPPGTTPDNQSGPIQINYVAPLYFGENIVIDNPRVVVPVKNTKTPFFQVTDLRGVGTGWTLNASLSDFVSTQDKVKKIKGASISFQSPHVVTTHNAHKGLVLVPNKVELYAGSLESVVFMTAKELTGYGTWAVTYPNNIKTDGIAENIVFHADSHYIEEQSDYEATLMFELIDGPSIIK